MRRFSIAAMAAVLFLAVPAIALAADDEVTVQGEVLDLACYISHEAKGPAHAKCAETCLKGGQPMGLLATDGTVYVLVANHQDASAYESAKGLAGKNVEIHGKVATRGALKALEVGSVQATPSAG